jgi:hypothetical protein
MRFDSDDEVDIESILNDFAKNPYSMKGRSKETDEAALRAASKMKEELAPGV